MSNLGDLMRTFADETNANLEAVIVETGLKMCNSVIKKTPVDSGFTQNSWFITSSRPSKQKPEKVKGKKYPNQNKVLMKVEREAIKKLKQAIDKQTTFYMVNNQMSASVLEYGLYPKNVKRGTWDRKKKRYEIRSANGYSKQAPAGMVRITKKEFKRGFIKSIKSMRAKK